MTMNNIMLDLECLDSRAQTAIIVSVGAVYFDLETGKLGNEFYHEINLKGLHEQYDVYKRSLSFDTLVWWMQQTDDARKVFWPTEVEKVLPAYMLHEFAKFCQQAEKVKVWGNGVDYDNVCLRSLYEDYNLRCPWHYSNNRCYRTFKSCHGNKAKLIREGVHHNALSDSITQAKHLLAMKKIVG